MGGGYFLTHIRDVRIPCWPPRPVGLFENRVACGGGRGRIHRFRIAFPDCSPDEENYSDDDREQAESSY